MHVVIVLIVAVNVVIAVNAVVVGDIVNVAVVVADEDRPTAAFETRHEQIKKTVFLHIRFAAKF